MTTSESKGRYFYKTNRFESIRITNRIESIRIANWNALACRRRRGVAGGAAGDGGTQSPHGSVCCRRDADAGGRWRCCLRGSGLCCRDAASTETVDVPGYRPACCQVEIVSNLPGRSYVEARGGNCLRVM